MPLKRRRRMKKDCVVITGGNCGLGECLTKLFKESVQVVSISRTKRKELVGVKYFYGSVADEQFVKSVYKQLSKEFNIKYLFNNAGVGRFGPPTENNRKKIDTVVEGCLVGTILNTTYAIPLMQECGGKIVNIMSTAALKGNPNETLYCACKWGARGYTESLKAYFKGSNIKVMGVFPGGINTPFWNKNRDCWSKEVTDTFMNADKLAKAIFDAVTSDGVAVSDITIDRI